MAEDLEAPPGEPAGWPADLYRARGDEVPGHRPLFTGDVFAAVDVVAPGREQKTKTVAVLQHPCALRTNGVDLVPGLLVAETRPHRALDHREWTAYGRVMPLPALHPELTSAKRDQAAFLEVIYIVEPARLVDRVACLSQLGVNLLLQRWVRHNSRVVVPTHTLNDQVAGVYEEAEVIEEWCGRALSVGVASLDAARECLEWLREDLDGSTRQRMLDDPQARSRVRRELRIALTDRYPSATTDR